MTGNSTREVLKNRITCRLLLVFLFLLMAVFLSPCLPEIPAGEKKSETLSGISGFRATLDSAEKAWLDNHSVLKVGGPRAFPPFHFFDADGKPGGMAIDYFQLVMGQLGLKIEIQNESAWPEVLKKARENEIDVIACAAWSPEREAYLLFSDPFLSFPMVILSRKDAPFIGGLDDLQGVKVAFIRENAVHEWVQRDQTDVIPLFVDTPLEALKAVSVGLAEAHIENLAAASFLIEKHGLTNLKVAAPTSYQNYSLHVAVRKDWPELVSIVNKAIHALSPEQHAAIRNKWLTVRYEFGVRMADIWKWVLMIAVPAFLAMSGIIGWNRRLRKEIAERERAEAAYRESEERFRMIAENTGSLIAVLDGKGIYEYANPAHRILGYAPGELAGTSGFALIHPDDQDRLALALQKGITGELSRTIAEYRTVGKDGRNVFIEGTFDSIRSKEGALEKIVFVGDDITERRRVQEALSRERQILAMVVKGINAGTWEWYVQSGKTVFNERWAEIAGYALEELQPVSIRTWTDICHPEDLKRSNELLELHFAGQLPFYECDCRIRHKDGHWVWVQDRGKVVEWSEAGMPVLMTGTHVDITQRKLAEAENAAMETQNRQRQKAESLGRMAGAIAHHFNNQLQAVMGNLELAVEDLVQGINPDKVLARAIQSTRKAADVSALMLTYLGQTSGKQEPMDLSEICRRNLPMLRAAMPNHVMLDSDLPVSGPVINANSTLVLQVLTHLVTNAWESIPDKGAVRLSVKTVSPEAVPEVNRFPIDWKPRNKAYACVEVSDSGRGITEMDIEKLFDPFFTTKFTGRGLGLSVILGIVRATGGAVTVESAPGQGSAFRIYFPVSEQKVPCPSDPPHALVRIADGDTLLLVEDEEWVRDMIAEMLSRMGITVIQARDGIEALEVFRRHPDGIRCVLTDLTMPRMNGWELISALRSIRPDIPIILASGYDKAQVMDAGHSDQPQAFLHKPYSMDELKNVLLRTLQMS